ncbi:MAG: hypothetical protein ACI9R3_001482 [Verrucomicrobiales bacterium]|jgi:hypothetical protein
MPITQRPRLKTNPPAGLIADILEHQNVTASRAARDMRIPRSRISDMRDGPNGSLSQYSIEVGAFPGSLVRTLIATPDGFRLELSFARKV